MKQTKTLAQVANDIENGNNLHEYYNNDGATIKTGNFESFGDFLSYFDMHYRPMLERIENGEDISENDRHLLNFLASDLLAAFKIEDSDEEDEDSPVIEPQDITDTDEDPTLTEAEEPEPFFIAGVKYRCTRDVVSMKGRTTFKAGNVYEQTNEPTYWVGWLRNEQGERHAWPQPVYIADTVKTWDYKPEDIDPRLYFEPVSE